MSNVANSTGAQGGQIARVAILMTCHNRVQSTVKCLQSLRNQTNFEASHIFLVDDGSSDGTGKAVKAAFPEANVIEGDGSLFWNGGMRLAWEKATASEREFDFYLWINDDVQLLPGTIEMLISEADETVARGGAVIATAATADPKSNEITYGGHARPNPLKRPLRMILQSPLGFPISIDTFSGNITLVSHAAYKVLGNISQHFEHIYGDLDYGLRAHASGIPLILASRTGGYCAANSVKGTSLDRAQPRRKRLRQRWLEDSRVHARDWSKFVTLHGGGRFMSWLYQISTYLRIMVDRPHKTDRSEDFWTN